MKLNIQTSENTIFFTEKQKTTTGNHKQTQKGYVIPCYSRICLFSSNLKKKQFFLNNFDTQQFRNI